MGLAGAIAVFAAHGRQWRWTGFDGNTSLWSWLQTFAQPFAFVYLTIRLISSAQSWRMWRIVIAVTGVLLTGTIVASYALHWRWTGFGGKQLWDWLHLMLFPREVDRRGRSSGFAVLLISGPLYPSAETRIKPRR